MDRAVVDPEASLDVAFGLAAGQEAQAPNADVGFRGEAVAVGGGGVEPSAGGEDAGDFGDGELRVGDVLEDVGGGGCVEGGVAERQALDLGGEQDRLYVPLSQVGAGEDELGQRSVDADWAERRTGGGFEPAAGTAAEVEKGLRGAKAFEDAAGLGGFDLEVRHVGLVSGLGGFGVSLVVELPKLGEAQLAGAVVKQGGGSFVLVRINVGDGAETEVDETESTREVADADLAAEALIAAL